MSVQSEVTRIGLWNSEYGPPSDKSRGEEEKSSRQGPIGVEQRGREVEREEKHGKVLNSKWKILWLK